MLSVHGFAPSAPGKENWEMVLEKYGQKWSRPGKEQPYGRRAAGSKIKPSAWDVRGLAVLSWEPDFLCVPPCYDSDQKFHFWPEKSSRWKFNYKSDVFPQETSVSANKHFFLKNCFIHTHKNLAPTGSMLEHYPGKNSVDLFNKNDYGSQLTSTRHTSFKELTLVLKSFRTG